MLKIIPAILAVAVCVPFAAVSPALAQNATTEPIHVRGSIESFSGNTLVVKTRDGAVVNIPLARKGMISGVAPADVSNIKPGDYVGIASLPTADGGDGALEVVIFPAALKGAGEGSYGWDLKPNSTMTNATVADAVRDVDGQTVTVSYHGQEKRIDVPMGTPAVTLAAATKADLKPGAVVFISAEKTASGVISAQQIVVGTHGVVPPM